MSSTTKAVIIAIIATTAIACSAQESGSRQMVIVFKDGHQTTISIGDKTSIGFKDAAMTITRGPREETFPVADIVRIEFNPSASSSFPLGRDHFLGKWKVGDGNGGTFVITLNPDGQASKTIGASHGTWVVVDGEARISWDDGWHDVIRKVGNKHEKFAYEPGKPLSDPASNVADAKSLNTQPI